MGTIGPSKEAGTRGRRTVLICGAGIAGPVLAYWLQRYGFTVTVVEQAGAPRGGGYPIDVRGTAIDVVRRMGLLPELRRVHIKSRRFTFLEADGAEVASLPAHLVDARGTGESIEIARGDLTAAVYEAVRDDVEFVFDDAIDALDQIGQRVEITFRSGAQRAFDIVIAAEGMHSRTREILFGPEEAFHRRLGYGYAVFTMPNAMRLSHELLMWNEPGKAAALYSTGSEDDALHVFLNFYRPDLHPDALRGPEVGKDLFATVFADKGWKIPDLIDAMFAADEFFCDTAGQIRLPHWSRGRVALVGDAAYAPSFLTGQGTSLALVGAYMLAHSLATNPDHCAAFSDYERGTRGFVAMNQALVDSGGTLLFPATENALEERNSRLRDLMTRPTPKPQPAHTALTLPAESWDLDRAQHGRGGVPHG